MVMEARMMVCRSVDGRDRYSMAMVMVGDCQGRAPDGDYECCKDFQRLHEQKCAEETHAQLKH